MNLAMDVLRIVTVRALMGRTWATDNVYDSPSSPADIRVASKRTPFIAVYCDEADTRSIVEPELSGPCDVRLVIEAGVASPYRIPEGGGPPVPVEDHDTGGAPEPNPADMITMLNATDPGLELQIGLITRQIRDALGGRADLNPWAELWRILTSAGKVKLVEVVRGGPAATDMKPRERFASRVTVLHLPILGEPVRGEAIPEGGFWFKFLAACAGDDQLKDVGELIRSHFVTASGDLLPEWRVAQRRLFLPNDTIRGLGFNLLEGGDAPAGTMTEDPTILEDVETAEEPFSPYPSEADQARLRAIREEDQNLRMRPDGSTFKPGS